MSELNAGALVAAGANWLVAGSSVFGGPDIEERFRQWRRPPPQRRIITQQSDQTLLQGGVKVPTGGTAREPREGPTR